MSCNLARAFFGSTRWDPSYSGRAIEILCERRVFPLRAAPQIPNSIAAISGHSYSIASSSSRPWPPQIHRSVGSTATAPPRIRCRGCPHSYFAVVVDTDRPPPSGPPNQPAQKSQRAEKTARASGPEPRQKAGGCGRSSGSNLSAPELKSFGSLSSCSWQILDSPKD